MNRLYDITLFGAVYANLFNFDFEICAKALMLFVGIPFSYGLLVVCVSMTTQLLTSKSKPDWMTAHPIVLFHVLIVRLLYWNIFITLAEQLWPSNYYKFYKMYYLVSKTPCFDGKNQSSRGHSRLTRSYSLNYEQRPECIPCNCNYSQNMF